MSATLSNFDLTEYATTLRALIENRLDEYIPVADPEPLWESMRYSVLQGGKRIRALLCVAAAQAAWPETSGNGCVDPVEIALPCACAIEMAHAMSLIHDDLPCMDNDDLRRGKPTNHRVFGEAMALLAGDALLVYASEILVRKTPASVNRDVLLDVVASLNRALGPEGMVAGQVADSIATGQINSLKSASQAPDARLLESIHKRKTGALLRFSTWSGAKLVGANETVLAQLNRFGEILGLAFQIADDLLDVTGNASSLGKTPGKDEAAGKLTYVTVFGVEGSQNELMRLETQGKEALKLSGLPTEKLAPLSALLEFAIKRSN